MICGKIALAGNPNVGKSTVFNALTGMKQHTGNWSGKTVGTAEGIHRKRKKEIKLIDLPGTYSLAADSAEEEVTRDFLCFEKFDGAVVVRDFVGEAFIKGLSGRINGGNSIPLAHRTAVGGQFVRIPLQPDDFAVLRFSVPFSGALSELSESNQ